MQSYQGTVGQQVPAQPVYTLELAVGEDVAHKEYLDYTRAKQAYDDAVSDELALTLTGVTRIELFSEAMGSMDKWVRGACTRKSCRTCATCWREPEVFEPHGWAQTDGPRINAFTQEFEIAEEWAMAGHGTVELLNREHVDAEIDRLRGEHQAHVTRLQAEVERLNRVKMALAEQVARHSDNCSVYRTELTKARELLTKYPGQTNSIYEKAWVRERNTFLSNQSAPADKVYEQ